MKEREYVELDATALAALVRAGEVTPSELVDRALARIAGENPPINAVVRTMEDHARAAIERGLPDGPLRGVPILVKDLGAHVAGVPTMGGCRLLAEFVPSRSSTLVERYLAAGAVIVGKTATPELGIKGVTESALHGATRNPWDLQRTPGGSSGGSAAAVAARMVPAAHGNDGGGSIRIPASCCGLVGLKPSRGRVPSGPHVGGTWSGFVQGHALTRTVRDSALLLDVVAGPADGEPWVAPTPPGRWVDEVGRDPGRLRIAMCTEAMLATHVDPACVAAVEDAAQLLVSLGHRVEQARPQWSHAELARAYLAIVAANTYAEVTEAERLAGRAALGDAIEVPTRLLYDIGRKASAGGYVLAAATCERVGRTMAEFHADWDVLMLPTIAVPPPRVWQFEPRPLEELALWVLRRAPLRPLLDAALDQLAQGMLQALPNTQPFNMSGQPAISLPLAVTPDGLPIGVQFVAPYGREDVLLRLAARLEQAVGWTARRPGVGR